MWSQLRQTVAGDRTSSVIIAVCPKKIIVLTFVQKTKKALFSLNAKNKSKQIYKIYKEISQSRDVSVNINLLQAGLLEE